MSTTNETAMQEEALYSMSETARLFGVSERTIHRWIREGRIPVYRLGRQLRFRKRDLEAFLEARREAPLARTPPLDFGQGRREVFIQRARRCVEARVAHYEKRLAEAERGGFFAGYQGAQALRDDAFDELMQLSDLLNGEMAERWLEDPEVPEETKTALGFALAEVMQLMVKTVGRIGGREAELAETPTQIQEVAQRNEQMSEETQKISA